MQRHVGPLAKEFMHRGVVTVLQDTNVEDAIKLMDSNYIGSVVVLDSLGPCGIFSERELVSRVLARGRGPHETAIAEVASPKFPSINSSATLEEVAAAMITKKSRLMVFEDAELVGIVTPTDLMKVLKNVEDDFSILRVISTRMVTVMPQAPVDAVVRLMDENRVGSVLLSENGRWTGIFTERDLVRKVLARRRGLDTAVRELATSPIVTAEPGLFGREAAGIMALHGFKRLPLSVRGEGVGIVTARDVVEAFANATSTRSPRIDWVQWN
ncbi:MAG: CBS domain-containing protein [Thaumarchaeota archaeon]|nr:CBS domain-containing protein [Nitrososphaerota archaeon]